MSLISQSPAWAALQHHWKEVGGMRMRDLFDEDPGRSARFSLDACGIHLDYSKNLVTDETMQRLMALAQTADTTAEPATPAPAAEGTTEGATGDATGGTDTAAAPAAAVACRSGGCRVQ